MNGSPEAKAAKEVRSIPGTYKAVDLTTDSLQTVLRE